MKLKEIERVELMTRREFAVRYDLLERPVIIQGGAENFRGVQTWNPRSLSERVGSVEVDFKYSTSHRHPDFSAPTLKEAFRRSKGTIAELITKVTEGPHGERARWLFTGDERWLLRKRDGVVTKDALLAPLLDDVGVPPLFDPERLYTVWAWISGRGVRTWLHYDNNGCHNLNAQITGKKHCVVYPPSALSAMAPFLLGGDNPAYNCSSLDIEVPGTLAAVEGFEGELRAGDLLFIPAWWFHTFAHHGEFNTNVNFWYKPERPSHHRLAARQALIDAAQQAFAADAPSPERNAILKSLDQRLVAS